jgi:hypothetical protein
MIQTYPSIKQLFNSRDKYMNNNLFDNKNVKYFTTNTNIFHKTIFKEKRQLINASIPLLL